MASKVPDGYKRISIDVPISSIELIKGVVDKEQSSGGDIRYFQNRQHFFMCLLSKYFKPTSNTDKTLINTVKTHTLKKIIDGDVVQSQSSMDEFYGNKKKI